MKARNLPAPCLAVALVVALAANRRQVPVADRAPRASGGTGGADEEIGWFGNRLPLVMLRLRASAERAS
jgi:hypothetical protein